MAKLIAHPENEEKSAALKAFMKGLKIRFEEENHRITLILLKK